MILKDTRITEYRDPTFYTSNSILKKYKFELRMWIVLVIIFLGLIPLASEVLTILFIIWYLAHLVHLNPIDYSMYSLNYTVTRLIKKISEKIWKFLNMCI